MASTAQQERAQRRDVIEAGKLELEKERLELKQEKLELQQQQQSDAAKTHRLKLKIKARKDAAKTVLKQLPVTTGAPGRVVLAPQPRINFQAPFIVEDVFQAGYDVFHFIVNENAQRQLIAPFAVEKAMKSSGMFNIPSPDQLMPGMPRTRPPRKTKKKR